MRRLEPTASGLYADPPFELSHGQLATATEDLEGSNAKTQVGTPDYMAPEVLEGRPYSAPADVFSLGATVYAMVAVHTLAESPRSNPTQS